MPRTTNTLDAIIHAALRSELDETLARQLLALGSEAVALAMLAVSRRIAQQDARLAKVVNRTLGQWPAPSTPSGMVPIYAKQNKTKRGKKPGAREGHPGHRRKAPLRIDKRETDRLQRCPCCGGALQRGQRKRTRTIEDIPEEIEPAVTEHTIHRDNCPKCRKHVEPVVPDSMPKAMLGIPTIGSTMISE